MINGRCRVNTELKTRGGKTMKQVCCTLGMKLLSLAKLIRWTLTFWLDKCEVLWVSSSYLVVLLMRPFNLQDSFTREDCFNYVDRCYRALQDCLCNLTVITSCRAGSSFSLYSYGSQLTPDIPGSTERFINTGTTQLIEIHNVGFLKFKPQRVKYPHLKIVFFSNFLPMQNNFDLCLFIIKDYKFSNS